MADFQSSAGERTLVAIVVTLGIIGTFLGFAVSDYWAWATTTNEIKESSIRIMISI